MRAIFGLMLGGICWLHTASASFATDFRLTATIGGAFDLNLDPISHETA